MPNRKDGEEVFIFVTGGFITLEVFNRVTSLIQFNAWSSFEIAPAMNIAITAAVMEEALYSFALTTFFFIAILYMVVKAVGRYTMVEYNAAMIMASVIVGVLFVLIHVGVYGFEPVIVIQLFVNRMIYAIVYIKTRNLTVPTALHLLHNFMVFV
jgi:membrane protease YdiL (CAAX protease family)